MKVGESFGVFSEERMMLNGLSASCVCFSFCRAFLQLMDHPGYDLTDGWHVGAMCILVLLTVSITSFLACDMVSLMSADMDVS